MGVVFTIIILSVGCVLLITMVYEAFQNNLVQHEFSFSDLPDSFHGTVLFFISDIHRRTISDEITQRVKGKANLVIIGGDLAERGVSFKKIEKNLQKLAQIAPVYFVWGNNDYEVNVVNLEKLMERLGITILKNSAVTFTSKNGEKWSLLGVDEMGQERDRLDLALENASASFKILVSHYPNITDKFFPEHGIRLVLSGHTHGGQIHILGYSPHKRGGVKKLANTTLLVSNGYGTTAIPLRRGAPAQCHLIELYHKSLPDK